MFLTSSQAMNLHIFCSVLVIVMILVSDRGGCHACIAGFSISGAPNTTTHLDIYICPFFEFIIWCLILANAREFVPHGELI